MICSYGLCLAVLILMRLFLDQKEGISLTTAEHFPEPLKLLGVLPSILFPTNFDKEQWTHAMLYTVWGIYEAQIDTVTDRVWGSEGVLNGLNSESWPKNTQGKDKIHDKPCRQWGYANWSWKKIEKVTELEHLRKTTHLNDTAK